MQRARRLSEVAPGGLVARTLFILAASIGWDSPVRGYPFCKIEAELQTIYDVAATLQRETGRWPSSIQELVAESDQRAPSCKFGPRTLLDPWGHPYHLIIVDGAPTIACFGRDGRLGGEGANADRFVSKPKR